MEGATQRMEGVTGKGWRRGEEVWRGTEEEATEAIRKEGEREILSRRK